MTALAILIALLLLAALFIVALQGGPLRVTALSEKTGLSQPNVSRHLKILVDAGLVARTRKGTTIECCIADERLFEVCQLLCGKE